MSETPFNKTIRLGLEARLRDHYKAGDVHVVNDLLDIYPTGFPRPEISVETARHVIEMAHRPYQQDTIEFPAIEAV